MERLKDGQVPTPKSSAHAEAGSHDWWRSLAISLAFAYDALRANRIRTGLTALGMVIGTSSVILVATIALTSRQYVLGQIEGVGSNIMWVYHERGGSTANYSISDALTMEDLRAVRQNVPHLAAVAATVWGRDRMMLDHREREVNLIGTNPGYRVIRNLKVLAGRFFDEQDEQLRARVCVVTEGIARHLFPEGWEEGRTIKIYRVEFTVIGIFKEGAQTFGQSEITDETAILPLSVMSFLTGSRIVDQIYASSTATSLVPASTTALGQVIRSRHRPSAIYRVENLTQILDAARNIATTLTLVLLLISAIALIISGIGIMNIMLVTVTERTREIGLRMALGAGRKAVRWQFLTEALMISVGGGLVGILVGVGIPLAAQSLVEGFQVPISWLSIVIAFGVACLVGVIFGIIPAERAAKLNPTEALRYE
ncbi:MAG: ABC transporter permease [Acidobacteria bacterium]|nr:ABC transporter permease [Acidobacteriota bacterium]